MYVIYMMINPFHLILCLELLIYALTFRHMFYELKKHILSLLVNNAECAKNKKIRINVVKCPLES